jgi:hypothetical protein
MIGLPKFILTRMAMITNKGDSRIIPGIVIIRSRILLVAGMGNCVPPRCIPEFYQMLVIRAGNGTQMTGWLGDKKS